MIDKETGEIIYTPFLKTPFNHDRDAESLAAGLACPEETKAQQNFKDEVDINTIVDRFGITGMLPQDLRAPLAEDYVEVTDFKTALDTINAHQAAFMQLPAQVRARFQNDPQQLLDFVGNDDNREEAEKLGLVIPRPKVSDAPGQAATENKTPD